MAVKGEPASLGVPLTGGMSPAWAALEGLPLTDLADVAAFVASDRAAALTGTVANLTGGIIVE